MKWAKKNKFIKVFHDHGIHPFVLPSKKKDPDYYESTINSFDIYILNNKHSFKNHFNFSDDQIEKFQSNNSEIELGIDHKEYSHSTKLTKENIASLSADFS